MELWRDVLMAVIGALAGLITALGTWSVQRAKLEQDARAAVATAWAGLCDEQQQRIAQLHADIERLQGQLGQLHEASTALQERVIALELENAKLLQQVHLLEAQTAERDSRILALERENNCLRGKSG